jgi:predicted O-methyltransferase YrrM
LAEEGRHFEMVFIDADLVDQWEQFDWAVDLTCPKGCVFLDDVVISMMKDRFGKTSQDSESFLTKIGRDERVLATLVLIVASNPMIPTTVFNGFVTAIV